MPQRNRLALNLAYTLLIVVVVGGAAVLAAWVTTALWAPALLRQQLQPYGWHLDNLALRKPGWRTLTIESIALTQTATARTINANDIVVHYQWRKLLHGHLEHVEIAQLHAVLTAIRADVGADAPLPISTLLPSELLARLPLNALRIDSITVQTPWPRIAQLRGGLDYRNQTLALNFQNTEQQPLTLQLQATINNHIDLQLRDQTQEIIALQNRFTPASKNSTAAPAINTAITGRLALDLDALQLLVPEHAAQLSGKLQANWHGHIPDHVDAQWQRQLILSGDISSTGAIATAALPRVQTSVASQFQFADGILSGAIKQGRFDLQLPMPSAIAKLYGLKTGQQLAIAATINPDTQYRIDLAQQTLTLQPVRIDASLRNKAAGIDSKLVVDQLLVRYGDKLAVESHGSITTPAIPLSQFSVQPALLSATVKFADAKLDGRWQLHDLANIYQADGTLSYRTTTGAGEIHVRLLPLTFRENGSYLPTLFRNWPWPVDFTTGSIKMQGLLRWDAKGLLASGTVETAKLGGFYNRNLVRGIDAIIDAEYHSDMRSGHNRWQVSSQPITIAEVQTGTPIRNISGTLHIDNNVVQLHNLSADLFGGKVTGGNANGEAAMNPTIRYTIGAEQNQLALQLSHLQLDQILALQEGVEGTGVIDGNIPLLLHNDGLRVDGAQLKARPPGGMLRYQGATAASAQPNPALALAFKALENFHYDTMTMRADFSLGKAYAEQSGDMLLAVALKGRNPTAPDTPPVNFNLNIRENIPDLLQTLQIGDDISDRIEQRIKKLQQAPRPTSKPDARTDSGKNNASKNKGVSP
jgi:hypothetical protein